MGGNDTSNWKIKHRGIEIDQGSKMNYETDGAP